MGDEKPGEFDYDALARAIALLAQSGRGGAVDQPPPNWVGDILGALAPLRALGPVHGELPEQDAIRLKDLQSNLSRADVSRALRPEDPECVYLAINVFQRRRGK